MLLGSGVIWESFSSKDAGSKDIFSLYAYAKELAFLVPLLIVVVIIVRTVGVFYCFLFCFLIWTFSWNNNILCY